MRTIRLCKGEGNGVDRACLATAVAMVNGQPDELDNPSCLCPVILDFIRPTNDMMPDDARAEFYGDLPWQLVGTATADEAVMRRRCCVLIDATVRVFTPMTLRAYGCVKEAAALESLDEIIDEESALAALAALDALDARAALAALDALDARAARAALAALAALDALDARDRRALWQGCRDVIVRMIAVAPPAPVEYALSVDELAEALA